MNQYSHSLSMAAAILMVGMNNSTYLPDATEKRFVNKLESYQITCSKEGYYVEHESILYSVKSMADEMAAMSRIFTAEEAASYDKFLNEFFI